MYKQHSKPKINTIAKCYILLISKVCIGTIQPQSNKGAIIINIKIKNSHFKKYDNNKSAPPNVNSLGRDNEAVSRRAKKN